MLKIHGLTKDDIPKIQGTGPRGRLLKGDVLAYVGSIDKDAPKQLEANFDRLAHLDLSNIKIRQPPKQEEAAAPAAEKKPKKQAPQDIELRYHVSLDKLLKVQHEVEGKHLFQRLPCGTIY